MEQQLTVCGQTYRIVRLLGHGKGGYSYLAKREGRQAVLKQIHHEPCDYYSFGNKIEAERRDYERLRAAGIRIPALREASHEEEVLKQVRQMAAQAEAAGLNIDYFPTNFVVHGGLIWYVDYECNAYMQEWNFENWGVKYWSRTPEFEDYLRKHAE